MDSLHSVTIFENECDVELLIDMLDHSFLKKKESLPVAILNFFARHYNLVAHCHLALHGTVLATN
jgi:hypothetical protein